MQATQTKAYTKDEALAIMQSIADKHMNGNAPIACLGDFVEYLNLGGTPEHMELVAKLMAEYGPVDQMTFCTMLFVAICNLKGL